MRNLVTGILAVIGIAVAIWISALLFLGLAAVAIIGYGLYFARSFLMEKGILNPTPGLPPEEDQPEQITIIEGDYEHIEEEKKD